MFTTSSIIDNLNQSEALEYKKLCRSLNIKKKSDKDKLDIALTALEKLEIINKNADNECECEAGYIIILDKAYEEEFLIIFENSKNFKLSFCIPYIRIIFSTILLNYLYKVFFYINKFTIILIIIKLIS